MKQRVTQSDVARVAGVHNTTVSLSLRNCLSIPEATRKRIRAIADQMGYYPDPTLQALVAYRKGRTSYRPKETLAYLTNWSARWGWRTLPAHEKVYIGAQRKAGELGYQLEHFWLGEPGMNSRRMSNMLYHRGITGVLLADHPENGDDLSEMDWTRLSAVKIGCLPQAAMLHRVTDDHASMTRIAVRQALRAGFERVGLVIAQSWDDLADQAWSGGYITEQGKLPAAQRIPVLRIGGGQQDWRAASLLATDRAVLARWYRDHRPEVIVGFSPLVLGQIQQLGLAVPREVAYIELCLERDDSLIAGVRQNGECVGEVAAALLVTQIQQNLRGVPGVATTTMVDGAWIDGASLPMGEPGQRCREQLGIPADVDGRRLLATA